MLSMRDLQTAPTYCGVRLESPAVRSQIVDAMYHGCITTPERRLLCAMLVQAMTDLDPCVPSDGSTRTAQWEADRRRAFMSALEWVASEDVEPFSFTWVCEELRIDAKSARMKILNGE